MGRRYDLEVADVHVYYVGPCLVHNSHTDIRLHAPGHGALSWATKKELPQPGQRPIAVYRQPLHSEDYSSFQGRIPEGYGAGTVKTKDKGEALITRVAPDAVHLTTAHTGDPQRLLFKATKDPRRWLALNTTPTEPLRIEKQRYKTVGPDEAETVLGALEPGASAQAKVDGSAALVRLLKGGPDIYSYRASKDTGRPIVHSERVLGGRARAPVPPAYRDLVLRGEVFGTDPAGRAIPPQELGGLLNAGLANSLRAQRERGVDLKTLLFDVFHGGKPLDLPYAERMAKLKEVAAASGLPPGKFVFPEEATTPEAALEMWRKIDAGKNPLTDEGVVLHPPRGVPTKIKRHAEHDVHVTGVTPGEGKYKGVGAGGFTYAHAPGGRTVGVVGGGLADVTRRQLWEDPESFIGRVARVRAQAKFPGGALRAPRLVALHDAYPLAKAAAGTLDELRRAHHFSKLRTPEGFAAKTQILRDLIRKAPHDWRVDSNVGGHTFGITHAPTGWRYHLPARSVGDLVGLMGRPAVAAPR